MRARVMAGGPGAGWGSRAGHWCTAVMVSMVIAPGATASPGVPAPATPAVPSAPSGIQAQAVAATPDPPSERWERMRARGYAQAQQSDWVTAAQIFTDLARETGAPSDRLAAMRALAQAGRLAESIDEGERLMAGASALAGPDRSAAVTELATLHESNGYRLRREDAPAAAARAFERSLELDPSRVRLLAEAGYARLAAGDRAGAAARFRQAIDQLPESSQDDERITASGAMPETASGSAPGGAATNPSGREAGDASSGTASASPERALRERLRREVREAERTWTLSAFQAWRPRGSSGNSGTSSAAAGSGGGAAGLQRDGLIAAQGGAELAWRLPEMRSAAGGHETDFFVRALWSQQGESLAINDRSVQGGVGLRWQPLVGSAWRLTAERLIAVGADARDDWLLRLAWGAMLGHERVPGRTVWPAGQLYLEAGRFFRDGGSTAFYGEGRLGFTMPLDAGWTVTPHGVVAAREVRPDPTAESWAEAGLGLALRRAFGGTTHSADRGRIEWLMQYRVRVSGVGRQGWLFAASVLW
ncbi:MAG: hypothetical protein KGR68_05460 [Betaproteobacteria bacterium]|nr:hypothetical protein [Betaproteobacteria bacterium]